jgi:hypothetical protein
MTSGGAMEAGVAARSRLGCGFAREPALRIDSPRALLAIPLAVAAGSFAGRPVS